MSAEVPLTLESIRSQVVPHGFSLHSHTGDRSCFTFVDDHGIFLEISVKERTAGLLYVHGLFSTRSGSFSWPHPRFANLFLPRIREIKLKLDSKTE